MPLYDAGMTHTLARDLGPAPLGVDYSFSHPDLHTVKNAGYSDIGRYLPGFGTSNKWLTPAEVQTAHSLDMGIWVVVEGSGQRATAGHAAGAQDAKEALRQANKIGLPSNCPIFFAVDFDATPNQVRPYFHGVVSVLGHRAGDYGGLHIVEAGLTTWHWQTCAWSSVNGQAVVSSHAHIYQRLKPTVAHPISGTDENVLLKPFPLWTKPHRTGPTHVTKAVPILNQGIATLQAGLAELDKTAAHRTRVHSIGDTIQQDIDSLQKAVSSLPKR